MEAPESEGRWRLRLSAPAAFVLRAAVWVLLLFALLRMPWVQQKLLLPFAAFQGKIGCGLFGTTARPGFVGLSCTGADPMALTLGAILAFPMAWKRRLVGAGIGLAMILGLNTVRIGHLSLLVGRPEAFRLFHVYLWPALLIVAAAAYVFFWMSRAGGPSRWTSDEGASLGLTLTGGATRRFVGLMVLLVALFYLASGWIMRGGAVLEVARWATVLAGAIMTGVGVSAEVVGNRLTTPTGTWVVTQACVATPLIPVYLAAVLSVRVSPLKRVVAVLATLPLFLLLGTGRLLVLALPAALVGSHVVAIHAFYQSLAALVIVVLVALGTGRSSPTERPAVLGGVMRALGAGALAFVFATVATRQLLWPVLERLAGAAHLGHGYGDSQGALLLLPSFQIGLLVALWVSLRRSLRHRTFAAALGVLVISQAVVVVALGELASHFGVEAPIAAIRALAIGVPLLLTWRLGRARESSYVTPASEPAPSHG